jgi:predicted Zn-dependent protease
LAAVLALLTAGLITSQLRKVDPPAAPTALLYLVADTQRELTRLPMKYTRIPDADEVKIGNDLAKEIAEPGSEQNPEAKMVEAYLQMVGSRLAAHAARKLPYKFHYLSDQYIVNAFALPGGHVFVGAGLLSLMENEDELAAVLGHEIEHIDHYHCVERLQTEDALDHLPLGSILSIPVAVFQAGYNKDQELEADREGTTLAVRAGYSADGAVQVFSRFQKMEEELAGKTKAASPEDEISGTAVQILTGYFASHPPSVDRIVQIRNLMAQENWAPVQEQPLSVRYIFLAHRAEGLVKAKKYAKAVEAADASLQLQPGYVPALVALAEASCAVHDFTKALAAYKELVASWRAEADAVRAFAELQGNAALAAEHLADAIEFATFSLQLQPESRGSLKLLAQAKLGLGDMSGALEAGRKLKKLYPTAANELNAYASTARQIALEAHHYAWAARYATFSLELEGMDLDAESALARSEFALGDFRAAADAYRRIIEVNLRENSGTAPPEAILDYADALGSLPRHAEAALEFHNVVHPGKSSPKDLNTIEEAGLLLVAGNDARARSLGEGRISFAPELAARLGWWYCRAGKYDAAEKVLHRFLALRPGDPELQNTLSWMELEENAPADRIRAFDVSSTDLTVAARARAGQAILLWRWKQTDTAIYSFERVTKDAPEWTNPDWVRAIYGEAVAQSTQEMYAEQQRRIRAATHRR